MELRIMRAVIVVLAAVLAAMVASPAFAKTPHPECDPNYAAKIPPGHEKHGLKFCGDTTPPAAPDTLFTEYSASNTVITYHFRSVSPDVDHFICELTPRDEPHKVIERDKSCVSPKTYSGLAPGDYQLTLWAVDTSRNVSEPNPFNYFTIY